MILFKDIIIIIPGKAAISENKIQLSGKIHFFQK